MSMFDDFLNSTDPLVQKAATLLDQTTTQYKAGQMSAAEYKEICGDILDFDHLSAIINDMHRKQVIYDAFQALLNIVETVASV